MLSFQGLTIDFVSSAGDRYLFVLAIGNTDNNHEFQPI